jgi:hypothetical protein
MWKLALPTNDDAESNIVIAFTYKNGDKKYPFTKKQVTRLLAYYDAYEVAKGAADETLDCREIKPKLIKALTAAYSEVQENGRLKKLRDRIFLNAKTCPCCGIVTPFVLDHHLPISSYQAFAIYSSNLIPYCQTCNNKKKITTGKDPSKRFVHAYYDEIPNHVRFLFCDVSIVNNGLVISFRIEKIPELSDQLFSQISFQINKVELDKRLNRELNLHLSGISSYLKSDFENGGKNAVRTGLLKSAETQKQLHGINHWRHAIMLALAENDEFCDGGFYVTLGLVEPV